MLCNKLAAMAKLREVESRKSPRLNMGFCSLLILLVAKVEL